MASMTWLRTRLAASIRGSPVSVSAAIEPEESMINWTLTCVPDSTWADARCGDCRTTPAPNRDKSATTSTEVDHAGDRLLTRINLLLDWRGNLAWPRTV